jgi:hypothetical protein
MNSKTIPDQLLATLYEAVEKEKTPYVNKSMKELCEKFRTLVNEFRAYPELEWCGKGDITKKLASYPMGKSVYFIDQIPTDWAEEEGQESPFINTFYTIYEGMRYLGSKHDGIVCRGCTDIFLFKHLAKIDILTQTKVIYFDFLECMITSNKDNLLEIIHSSLERTYGNKIKK